MELLNHLKHPHPLVLSQEKYDDAFECMVCCDWVSGLCYCCNECVFVVHKWCAELPLELTNHPLHLDHPRLVLLSAKERGREDAKCVDCEREIRRPYAFSCEKCSFVLHPTCALLPKELEFEYNDIDSPPVRRCLTFKEQFGDRGPCELCKEDIGRSWFDEKNSHSNSFHIQCALLPKTVKHDRHIHDLTLHVPIEKDKSYYGCVCDLCEEDRDPDQWLYYCTRCEVAGHLSCGLLGYFLRNKAILTSNRVYTVKTEPHSFPPQVDRDSEEYMKALGRRLPREPGDMEPLGKLVHFSHEHPLFLYDEVWNGDNICRACEICIYGKIYVCVDCKFVLHKWCAELPKEVHFGFHFEHPLTVLSTHSLACSYCRVKSNAFSFCCLECNFGVHTTCAFLFEFREHRSHCHPLQVLFFKDYMPWKFMGKIPMIGEKTALCNACLFPCKGMSLGCKECGFYLHIGCSLYPPTGKAKTHMHNLNLTYSYQEEPGYDEFICDACEKSRIRNRWVYCCPGTKCEFVSHLDCAVPNLFPNSSCEKEKGSNDWVYYRPSPSLHLLYGLEAPVLDQPIQRILKSDPVYAFLRDKYKSKVEELKHFGHEHPLVLSNEKWNAAVRCEGCSRGIYGKTYSCHECGYHLHKLCAQIPREMHFRFHPEHPLILLPSHEFECSVCEIKNLGFSFSCETCDFEAHTLCVLMPDRDLDCHEHPTDVVFIRLHDSDPVTTCTFPEKNGQMPLCDACQFPCEGMTMKCKRCDFYLHVGCAWYPHTCKTEWHTHVLTLWKYEHSLVPLNPFFCNSVCDVCDKTVTPSYWRYTCLDKEYNTLAHIDCAVPNLFLTSSFESILVHRDE